MREEKTDDEKHREHRQTIPSRSSSPRRARRFSFPLRDAPRVGEIRRGRPTRHERSLIRERPLAGLAALQLATTASPTVLAAPQSAAEDVGTIRIDLVDPPPPALDAAAVPPPKKKKQRQA